MPTFRFEPIGIVQSPFTDKFGIPRQPRLADAAEARVLLLPPYDRNEAFEGLEGFSHAWLVCVFHDDCLTAGWKPMVRPPRLGGREKVGVFASRAPYRPNPIGISAVEQHGLERGADGLALRIRGVDLLDGTPVLDIKPYVPYADAIADARSGFAIGPPDSDWRVAFTPEADAQVAAIDPHGLLHLRTLIEQVLAQDPRPGYMNRYPKRKRFALRLYDVDVAWEVQSRGAVVRSVTTITPRSQGG